MKKILISIPVALAFILSSCGADVSRRMDYRSDMSYPDKGTSSGAKVHYPDAETGYVRDHDDGKYLPYELNNGTNQQQRNVKEPMPWTQDQQRTDGPNPYNP